MLDICSYLYRLIRLYEHFSCLVIICGDTQCIAPKNSASDAKARYDEMERKRTASDFTKETEKEQIPMVEEEIVVPTATASVATAIVGAAIDEAVKVASSRKA